MPFKIEEIVETISMVEMDHFDVRTVTMGINLLDCADSDPAALQRKIVNKVMRKARDLARMVDAVSADLGIPIANKRIAVTPLAIPLSSMPRGSFVSIARALDGAVADLGIDFLGGYSALVPMGITAADVTLIASIPEVLATTSRI